MATVRTSLDPTESPVGFDIRFADLRDIPATDANLFRHSGWERTRSRVWAALVDTSASPGRMTSFSECGSHAYVLESVDHPGEYRVAGSTCHDRFCVPCATERSGTIAANVADRLGKKQARFLTLTLKSDNQPLAPLLAKLTRCFSRLRATKFWRTRVTGGCGFLEVKWVPEAQRWNVHMHVIVQGLYLPKRDISRLWHRITVDSYIVDIRLARDPGAIANECAKYATKPLHGNVLHDHDRLCEAMLALRGKRLVVTFGDWESVAITAKPDTEGWVHVCSLNQLIADARGGCEYAAALCGTLGVGSVILLPHLPLARAPPAPPHTVPQLSINDELGIPIDRRYHRW